MMASLLDEIGRKFLFRFDPETAHGLSISALQTGLVRPPVPAPDPRLAVTIAGLTFNNPIGMAAGYDKNGDVPNALLSLGFGHVEVGTVTPQPQPGNPKPRIFRLEQDRAVINRLGFNSLGHEAVYRALLARPVRTTKLGIVGVNVGANKSSEDFGADYVSGILRFHDVADYLTANISSPNTPGLRSLQTRDPLTDLLTRICDAREEAVARDGTRKPLFLKIAPDLSNDEIDTICEAVSASDIDALIVSNTTLSREGLKDRQSGETGGLSGRPLLEHSTLILSAFKERLGDGLPLIGVGGVYDAPSAIEKLKAGASLVQLYTGLIYEGVRLPGNLLKGMVRHLDDQGLNHISEIR